MYFQLVLCSFIFASAGFFAAPVKTGDWNSPLTTVNPWDGLNIMTGWLSSKKLVTHQLPRLLSFKISPQSLNTLYQSQSNLLAFRGFVIYQASYLNKQLGFAPVSERGMQWQSAFSSPKLEFIYNRIRVYCLFNIPFSFGNKHESAWFAV